MSKENKHDSGAAQGSRRATEQSPESSAGRAGAGRWSAQRKVGVILELLRGADPESTSRKYRVTVATLTQWRDEFLAHGEARLKSREVAVEDEETRRLKSVVANLSVDNELLREKTAKLEGGLPTRDPASTTEWNIWKHGSRSPAAFRVSGSTLSGGPFNVRANSRLNRIPHRSRAKIQSHASRPQTVYGSA